MGEKTHPRGEIQGLALTPSQEQASTSPHHDFAILQSHPPRDLQALCNQELIKPQHGSKAENLPFTDAEIEARRSYVT